MFAELRKNPRALFYAVLVHVVIVGLLVVSLQWTPQVDAPGQAEPIVQAVAVDEKKVADERKKLAAAEARREAAEERKREQARRAAAEARDKRLAEEQRLKELQAKKVTEERRQQEAERKRLAEQKAEQQRLERLRKEREAEEQRLAALEAERKMAEERRRREEEARRKEEEARRQREEDERALQQQIAEEQQRLEAERQRLAQQTIGQHSALIRQAVSREWLRPTGSPNDLKATFRVRTIPSGDVVMVETVKTSGDSVFDRSAEAAIRRASPLPVPRDADSYEAFREFNFEFDPSKG